MLTTMCDESRHELCDEHIKLGRLNRVCECWCHGIFKSPSQFLESVSKLSRTQKDRMLMDLAWKCWVKPTGMTSKRVAIQSFTTARLIP